MGGIAFPFVASPEVNEVVMGDLVEVALGVFARLDPLFLDEPIGVLEDFSKAFLAEVVFVHHGVLFEGLDGFVVLAEEVFNGVVDLFLPGLVELFCGAHGGFHRGLVRLEGEKVPFWNAV